MEGCDGEEDAALSATMQEIDREHVAKNFQLIARRITELLRSHPSSFPVLWRAARASFDLAMGSCQSPHSSLFFQYPLAL